MSELTKYLTINQSGKVVEETEEGYSFPADYSFETVNEYVHQVGRQYEELEYLCLGMANHFAKLEAELKEAKKDAERYRWLREHPHLVMEDYEPLFVSAEKIDDAVDKAIDEFLKG